MKEFEQNTRHYKLAMKVLKEDCYKESRWRGYTVVEDDYPYHIIVKWRKISFSVWCGGFTKNIEIMRITENGKPDDRFKERSYASAVAAFNWLDRYFRKLGVKQ